MVNFLRAGGLKMDRRPLKRKEGLMVGEEAESKRKRNRRDNGNRLFSIGGVRVFQSPIVGDQPVNARNNPNVADREKYKQN
jgi:hypothetical protein